MAGRNSKQNLKFGGKKIETKFGGKKSLAGRNSKQNLKFGGKKIETKLAGKKVWREEEIHNKIWRDKIGGKFFSAKINLMGVNNEKLKILENEIELQKKKKKNWQI